MLSKLVQQQFQGGISVATTDATAPDTDDIEIETVDEPDIADIEPKKCVVVVQKMNPQMKQLEDPRTPTTEVK